MRGNGLCGKEPGMKGGFNDLALCLSLPVALCLALWHYVGCRGAVLGNMALCLVLWRRDWRCCAVFGAVAWRLAL